MNIDFFSFRVCFTFSFTGIAYYKYTVYNEITIQLNRIAYTGHKLEKNIFNDTLIHLNGWTDKMNCNNIVYDGKM